jgi:hypothetical protein
VRNFVKEWLGVWKYVTGGWVIANACPVSDGNNFLKNRFEIFAVLGARKQVTSGWGREIMSQVVGREKNMSLVIGSEKISQVVGKGKNPSQMVGSEKICQRWLKGRKTCHRWLGT